MKLVPLPENVGASHSVHLEWAPWERDVELSISATGAVITTGKAVDRDGISRTLNLVSDKPVFVLFGAGEIAEESQVVNIRRGWTLGDRGASTSEREHGPAGASND